MRYLNCFRPERFDEFFMNGFHRLLFWSDVSCLWWLIKQWIITALAITCDKNMVWAQMTGIFFIYIDIIARLHKERRYLIIKKKKEKKLDWTWPPRTQLRAFSLSSVNHVYHRKHTSQNPPSVQCGEALAPFDQACPLSVWKLPKRAGSRDELMVSCLPARAS